MNPPPKASSENSSDSRRTMPFERPSPSRRRMPSVAASARRGLDARAEPREADRHREPEDRVADDDRPVRVDRRRARRRAGPG